MRADTAHRKIDTHIYKIVFLQFVSLRISAAKGYLEKSGKNINEISNIVGYENPLYFSRLFKKYTGLTPTEYKKRHKTKALRSLKSEVQ